MKIPFISAPELDHYYDGFSRRANVDLNYIGAVATPDVIPVGFVVHPNDVVIPGLAVRQLAQTKDTTQVDLIFRKDLYPHTRFEATISRNDDGRIETLEAKRTSWRGPYDTTPRVRSFSLEDAAVRGLPTERVAYGMGALYDIVTTLKARRTSR